MPEAVQVPVLFVSEPIVLPGMVVPIELDDAARAAVDAAQASESGKLLIAPRLDDRYPTYGVLASIVQVGRIPGGGAAAVVKGEKRAHIGSGTTGPGAALWVLVDEVADPVVTDETRALAAEYKKLLLAMLQRREAWQIVDVVNKITDPSALADTAGYASYLTDVQKRELLETADVSARLRILIDVTAEHLAEVEVTDKIAEDVRAGMDKQQKEFLLRQQLNAIRKELGEGEADGHVHLCAREADPAVHARGDHRHPQRRARRAETPLDPSAHDVRSRANRQAHRPRPCAASRTRRTPHARAHGTRRGNTRSAEGRHRRNR